MRSVTIEPSRDADFGRPPEPVTRSGSTCGRVGSSASTTLGRSVGSTDETGILNAASGGVVVGFFPLFFVAR